jgi:hypothetical protein
MESVNNREQVYILCDNLSISFPKFGICTGERYQSNTGVTGSCYLKFYWAVKRKLDDTTRHDTTRRQDNRNELSSARIYFGNVLSY